MPQADPLAAHLRRWNLTPDGAEIVTAASRLVPARRDGVAAMLKIIGPVSDETRSAEALRHFAGRGAVAVLADDKDALLLERAVPGTSLSDVVAEGRDDEATAVIADMAAALDQGEAPAGWPTLEDWGDGFPRQKDRGAHPLLPPAMLDRAAVLWRDLCAAQGRRFLLHGDLHHDNILCDERRGWLVIDPKGVVGEAAFEVVPALGNPHRLRPLAADVSVMARRVAIFSERLGFDRERLAAWAFAHRVLSACWTIEDGNPDIDARRSLAVASAAAALL